MLRVLLDGVFVVDAGDEPLVGDEQQREPGPFVNAAALRLDDAVLDLIAHAEAVPAADGVRLEEHVERRRESAAVDCDRMPLVEADRDRFSLHRHVVAPEGGAHDRLDDGDALVEELEVLRFVGGARMFESVE